jgi:3-phosphoshikimate 1-carboxyvinyltransferase
MTALTYPDRLEIRPYGGPPLSATVSVPGSKSITNRALVLAALRTSFAFDVELTGALQSEDTEVMVAGLRQLGFQVQANWPTIRMQAHGEDRLVPAESADIFVANSGTTMRFLTALCAVGNGRYRLDGVPRMRERPIEDLLAALRGCGVTAYSELDNGCPPVIVEAEGWFKGEGAVLKGDVSSQFVSALLMVAPFNHSGHLCIKLTGPLVSEPYVRMTERMMLDWGACWRFDATERLYVFDFESMAGYLGRESYAIEPDASAASYFWAAAAILGGRVTVTGLTEHSLQGDVAFVDVLQQMGCRVEKCDAGITVHGAQLRGIDVDMNAISDTVMTLGAVACFADGPTRIRNVAHIRHKETDRIAALATELRRLGAEVEEFVDGLQITPRPLHGATVQTYNDHRMAMSLALVGLRVPGVVIDNPGCVAKTYPGFWQDLDRLLGR